MFSRQSESARRSSFSYFCKLKQSKSRLQMQFWGVCRWGGTGRQGARTSTAPASCPTSGRRHRPRWRPRGCGPARRRPGRDTLPHGAGSCGSLQTAWCSGIGGVGSGSARMVQAPIAQHVAAVWRGCLFRGSACGGVSQTWHCDWLGSASHLQIHDIDQILCGAATRSSLSRCIEHWLMES